MKRTPFRLNALAALLATSGSGLLATAHAQTDEPLLSLADVIVVSGSRVEHASFDLPAAIDVVDYARLHDGQLRVNLSEALSTVPGLVVQNRQNYAQDLQLSSRGFGARSAFGVRGVRLITDGIPATMPDGQGQAATFNLDTAERIEVLRGPYSAIYGNHAGGVVQLFTRNGQGPLGIETSVSAGSFGTHKIDMNARGEANGVGYVVDASNFETDGYRDHSAARRTQGALKLTAAPTPTSDLTIIASSLTQGDTQDPLGVSWTTYLRDPRAGEIDATDTAIPKRTFAQRYDTRKSIDHQQGGLSFEQRLGDDRLRVTAYGGNRSVIQYQSFSKGFQAAASQSGGVVDFDRRFDGADLNWLTVRTLAGGHLSTTVGLEYGHSRDDRRGFENFIGSQLGVIGKLRRDEQDLLSTVDPYLQSEWQAGAWLLTAGLRHSSMRVEVKDHYLANGDDGGKVSYSNTTPLFSVLYKVTPLLNVYVSAARGFETPTLNELFYSSGGAGFNFNLAAARSNHVEGGLKAIVGSSARVNAALFQVRTTDELVVDTSGGGRTSYRNASKTLRQGAEVSVDSVLGGGFNLHAALTSLRAVYDQGYGTVQAGSRLPGVPNANAYLELAWKDALDRFGAAIETIASSRVYAEDSNNEIPAPGYGIANLRLQARQKGGGWDVKQFARVNNLFNRTYIGSVIVGDSNKRYYEAAPARHWQLGISARHQF